MDDDFWLTSAYSGGTSQGSSSLNSFCAGAQKEAEAVATMADMATNGSAFSGEEGLSQEVLGLRDLDGQLKQLKSSLAGLMDRLQAMANKYNCQAPSADFSAARRSLERNQYSIVVCGEVKQGKSSFINALLGRHLLPVEVKVTTSQIFCISRAEKESYALVFEGGHREEISQDDLNRYGTQEGQDLGNMPLLRGRKLSWIEVNTPAQFLPWGIKLFDTPGLGALYSEHAEVTARCLSQADAVIFLKECNQPVVEQECSFLQTAFAITKNIMFVQTKCDLLEDAAVKELAKRNEKVLNEKFSAIAARPLRFWPTSSLQLFEAAQESDLDLRDMLRESAGFDDLFYALQALFFRTSGFTSTCGSCTESWRFYQQNANFIKEQIGVLSTSDVQVKRRLQQEKAALQQRFVASWGPNGSQRQKFESELSIVINGGERKTAAVFSMGSDISSTFSQKIEELDTVSQAEELGKTMPSDVVQAVMNRLSSIGMETQNKISNLLGEMSLSLSSMSGLYGGNYQEVKIEGGSHFLNVARGFMGGFSLGSMATGLLVSVVAAPVAVAVALIGGVVSFFLGKAGANQANQQQLQSAKSQLKNGLSKTLCQLNNQLCVPQGSDSESQIQHFFRELRDKVVGAVQEVTKGEERRLANELADLETKAQMDAEAAKLELQRIKELQSELAKEREPLLKARDTLAAIDKKLVY